MAEGHKRPLPDALDTGGSPKRARTDPSTTNESVDVTQALLSAGAVTVESAIERSVAEQERERRSVRSGRVLGVTLVDGDEDESEAIKVDEPAGESSAAPQTELDAAPSPVKDEPVPLASTSALPLGEEEPVEEEIDYSLDPDDRNRDPVGFLGQYWSKNISRSHGPKYSVQRDDDRGTFGATLHLHIPPGSTRSFTLPPTHKTSKLAKIAVTRLAMAHNMLEIGAAARAAAGPMPQQLERSAHDNSASVAAAEGENADTVDNPIAILYMTAMQNLGPSGVPEFEFVPDRTGTSFGCKLSIRISPEAVKAYEVPAVYRSQKLAKDGAARAALRDHVLTQIRAENSIEAQLRREAEADDAAALANGKGVLSQSQMAAALERGHGFLAEQMMLAGLPGTALDYSTFAGSTQPPSHGARLRIVLGPGDVRTYEVDARFRNKREARSGVARQAIKSGLIDDLQKMRDNLVAERERQRTQRVQANGSGAPPPPPPRPGSIADEDADKLHNPVGYIQQCFQIWTGRTDQMVYDFFGTGVMHGCTLHIRVGPAPEQQRSFTVDPQFPSKMEAKNAVTKLALKAGVLNLIRPRFGPQARHQLGNANRVGMQQPAAPPFANGPIMMPQQPFHRGQGPAMPMQPPTPQGSPPIFSPGILSQPTFAPPAPHQVPHPSAPQLQRGRPVQPFPMQPRPPPGFNPTPPPPASPSLNGFGIATPQYNGQPMPFSGPSQMAPPAPLQHSPPPPPVFIPPAAPLELTPVVDGLAKYLEDFCSNLIGPGRGPTYEIRRDDMTGLFGAVARIQVTPDQLKAYWTDKVHRSPNAAREAAAQAAVTEGIVEAVSAAHPRQAPAPGHVPAHARFGHHNTRQHGTKVKGTDADAESGLKSVAKINTTCQTLLGPAVEMRPVYDIVDNGTSRYGATLTIPLGDFPAFYQAPNQSISKFGAREHVATIAIQQGVIDRIKDYYKTLQGHDRGAVPPRQVAAAAAAAVGVVPNKAGQAQLRDYCRQNGRDVPRFHAERVLGEDDHQPYYKVWITIADLKFELDKERFTDESIGYEKLSGRVLRHLVKQDKATKSASGAA